MVYFEKTQPSPTCLDGEKTKASGDYKCGNVLDLLRADFKNKCYICESKEPVTINIEHFRPHKGDVNLKFKWENLFWSCSHCNNTKSDNYEDIIDCTDINEDVENRIKISMNPFPMEKVIIDALDQDQSTISTVKLLNDVYNGTTKLKTIESSNLRNKILKEIIEFQNCLCQYYESDDDDYKNYFLLKIQNHLKKSSNFTSLKRWIVRDNPSFKAKFEQYFD